MRIIYSGDTRPCQNFINYARDSTLLIHEATLGKGMEKEAWNKKHTTTTQAIDIIKETKPWRSILTHFSCRYQKVAEILPEHLEEKVLVAFDHMRLELKDLDWAYLFVSIFDKLFSNEREKPTQEFENLDLNEKDMGKGKKRQRKQ